VALFWNLVNGLPNRARNYLIGPGKTKVFQQIKDINISPNSFYPSLNEKMRFQIPSLTKKVTFETIGNPNDTGNVELYLYESLNSNLPIEVSENPNNNEELIINDPSYGSTYYTNIFNSHSTQTATVNYQVKIQQINKQYYPFYFLTIAQHKLGTQIKFEDSTIYARNTLNISVEDDEYADDFEPNPSERWYNGESVLHITAPIAIETTPDSWKTFSHWEVAGETNQITRLYSQSTTTVVSEITLKGPSTVTAVYDNAIEVTVAGIDKNKYGILDESTWRNAGSPSFKDILVHLTVEGNANSYTFPTGEEQDAIPPGNITLELDEIQDIQLDVSNLFAGDDLILDFNAWGWNGSSGNPFNIGYVDSSFTEAVYFDIKEFLFQKKMHPVPEVGKGWKPDFYQGNKKSWDNIHDTFLNNDEDGIYRFKAEDCPMNFKIDNEQYKYGEWGWVFDHWEINNVEYPGSIDHQNFNNIDAPLECTPTILEAFYNPYLEIRAKYIDQLIEGFPVQYFVNGTSNTLYSADKHGNYNGNIARREMKYNNEVTLQIAENAYILSDDGKLKYTFSHWETDSSTSLTKTFQMDSPKWPVIILNVTEVEDNIFKNPTKRRFIFRP
jgi:hypothetical protein